MAGGLFFAVVADWLGQPGLLEAGPLNDRETGSFHGPGHPVYLIVIQLPLGRGVQAHPPFFERTGAENMADILYTLRNQVYANITNKCNCA